MFISSVRDAAEKRFHAFLVEYCGPQLEEPLGSLRLARLAPTRCWGWRKIGEQTLRGTDLGTHSWLVGFFESPRKM